MTPPPNRRNHYRVLHVQPEAPLEVIKASYRAMMMRMKLHPDLGGDHDTAAIVNEAYAVLSDPQRRAEYDRQLRLRSRPEMMRKALGSSNPQGPTEATAAPSPAPKPQPPVAQTYAPATTAPVTAHELYARIRPVPAPPGSHRMTCAFCQLDNLTSRAGEPLCSRCGAPLTPVRQAAMPNFGALGLNRRQSVRRPRQAEAVAYWGLPPERHRVQWRDLSAGGLSLWATQALPVGQRIQVLDPEIHTVAEVVACEAGPRQTWLIRARLLTLRTTKRAGLFCAAQA